MKKTDFPDILIKNGRVILNDTVDMVKKTAVLVKKGKIRAIGSFSSLKSLITSQTHIIDAKNNYVSPGFIDLHIHGEPDEIARSQAPFGTTSFLMGFHGKDVKRLERITQQKNPMCVGVYCEGPFLNPEMRGAIPENTLSDIKISLVKSLQSYSQYPIKVMTFSPELAQSKQLVAYLQKNSIIPSIGHSSASYTQTKFSIQKGAKLATHCFNRMSLITPRDPGVLGAVLGDDTVSVELVVDGMHIHPENIRLAMTMKGKEKIILVTDNVTCYPMPNSVLTKKGFRLKNTGVLAGSTLTMNKAIKNMIDFTQISIPEAVRMASLNPSKLLKIDKQKGSIAKGKDADLVIFDEEITINTVCILGKIIFQKRSI